MSCTIAVDNLSVNFHDSNTAATPHSSSATKASFCRDATETSGEPVSKMNHMTPSDQMSALTGSYSPPATTSGAM
ncbi:hypothetical protein PF007_g28879 [Phytophthora fragariae]|uniref:Uncharacterized protein n=1 Tax=Phytophthora fragariae TaxID=53985 RepID=A0A6A3PYS6_9STRA|nr:hypothetical protein PF007_g28879 [Phytophthora fragariae]KAE9278114.1 hypothetical protein PF008_g28696 [Phytophthora fragariae]